MIFPRICFLFSRKKLRLKCVEKLDSYFIAETDEETSFMYLNNNSIDIPGYANYEGVRYSQLMG